MSLHLTLYLRSLFFTCFFAESTTELVDIQGYGRDDEDDDDDDEDEDEDDDDADDHRLMDHSTSQRQVFYIPRSPKVLPPCTS
jgi:hypothetical protein